MNRIFLAVVLCIQSWGCTATEVGNPGATVDIDRLGHTDPDGPRNPLDEDFLGMPGAIAPALGEVWIWNLTTPRAPHKTPVLEDGSFRVLVRNAVSVSEPLTAFLIEIHSSERIVSRQLLFRNPAGGFENAERCLVTAEWLVAASSDAQIQNVCPLSQSGMTRIMLDDGTSTSTSDWMLAEEETLLDSIDVGALGPDGNVIVYQSVSTNEEPSLQAVRLWRQP